MKAVDKVKYEVRENPPTVMGALVALLAAVVTDLRQIIDWGPLSDETVTLLTVVIIGFLGGVIGKLTQRFTFPWYDVEDEREDYEIELDDPELA